jgi:hypothetical protein
MIVEYPTLFGGSAFFRLALDGPTTKIVQDTVARIRGLAPHLISL